MCVIRLTEPLEFKSSAVQPADFSTRAYNSDNFTVTAVGWSSPLSVPQKIDLTSVEIKECKRLAKGKWTHVNDQTVSCTVQNPFQEVDVGGPILFRTNKGQFGVMGLLEYVGSPKVPAIYTKISVVWTWIQNVAFSVCPTPISILD